MKGGPPEPSEQKLRRLVEKYRLDVEVPVARKYGKYYQPTLWPYYPEIPVFQLLRKSAVVFPDKPFILCPQRITFGELDVLTDKLATALAELGVRKGNTVGLFMWNSPEFIISFFGVLKAGATVTAVNPSLRDREVKYQLEDSESVAVIVEDENYPIIKRIREGLPKLKEVIVAGEKKYPETHLFQKLIDKHPPNPPKVKIDPTEDLAVIQYTAGITSSKDPKGCMLTHHNLVSNVFQVLTTPGLELSQNDIVLAHLPFDHIYGLSNLICLPARGGVSVVIQRQFDVGEFLELIEKFKVTLVCTVMPVLSFLTSYPELLKKYDLSSLRCIVNGGVPLDTEVARRFQKLTGVPVTQGYGLSETSPTTHVNPLSQMKPGSVGPPLPDTHQKIVDLKGGKKELPPGEVGEILVKGPQVMKGYWKKSKDTAEVLTEDGWLYTGDVGKIDEDGYLYIVDRKKEIIKYMGFTVGLAELEGVLMEHPGVADCAAIGKPDPVSVEIPKAFVMLKEGAKATEEELINFVRDRVAGYKRIREIEFVKSIPRSPAGKVLRGKFIKEERKRAGIETIYEYLEGIYKT